MTGRYYPLDFGSFDKNKMLAMQYSSDDGLSGTALIYKRAEVTASKYTVRLNGLVPEKEYSIYDIDNPDKTYIMTGEALMRVGLSISLPDGEKAIFLMYSAE